MPCRSPFQALFEKKKKCAVAFRCFLALALVLFFLSPNFDILAQDSNQAAEEECGTREECEALLKKIEEEISQYEGEITKTEQEKQTLQNKISILKNQIKKLNLQIQQSNLVIGDLTLQIKDTENSIGRTILTVEDSQQNLINILRVIYEEDQRSLVEILLAEGIADFFDNLSALEALNVKTQDLLGHIKSLKSYLETQKQSLDEEKDATERMVVITTLQRQENEGTKSEQENLLRVTQGKEEEYQKLLQSTQKKAQEIRTRIFELIGVPEAPTFGEALEIAKFVYAQTGIRPALLLAVLTQESNIGKNVGQCFLKDAATGAGIQIRTQQATSRVMNPKRDVPHFLNITKELDRDPYNSPVSCPMSYGWGGAMGPAQFIPSTWVLYKGKVSAITGTSPNPWNIKDSFLAAGVYLKELGGDKNEFNAVMKYFSGASWSKYEEFYARSVLGIAARYEQDIAALEEGL